MPMHRNCTSDAPDIRRTRMSILQPGKRYVFTMKSLNQPDAIERYTVDVLEVDGTLVRVRDQYGEKIWNTAASTFVSAVEDRPV